MSRAPASPALMTDQAETLRTLMRGKQVEPRGAPGLGFVAESRRVGELSVRGIASLAGMIERAAPGLEVVRFEASDPRAFRCDTTVVVLTAEEESIRGAKRLIAHARGGRVQALLAGPRAGRKGAAESLAAYLELAASVEARRIADGVGYVGRMRIRGARADSLLNPKFLLNWVTGTSFEPESETEFLAKRLMSMLPLEEAFCPRFQDETAPR